MRQINFMRSSRAFTLLEIIMVMVIIGLLVAIIAPEFFSFRKEANISSVKSTLITLSEASEMYYLKKGLYPVSMNDLTAADGQYLQKNPCGTQVGEYWFTCVLSLASYNFMAATASGQASSFTISTGGLRQVNDDQGVRDGWD